MQFPAPKAGEAPQHGTPAGATPPEPAQEHSGHPPALPGPPSTIPALQHAGPPRSGPPAQHHMQGSRPHSPRGRGSGSRGGRWDGHRGGRGPQGPQGWGGGGGSDWDYRGHRGGHRGGGERGHMPLQPPPGPPILPQQQWGPQGYPAAAGQYQGYPPGMSGRHQQHPCSDSVYAMQVIAVCSGVCNDSLENGALQHPAHRPTCGTGHGNPMPS